MLSICRVGKHGPTTNTRPTGSIGTDDCTRWHAAARGLERIYVSIDAECKKVDLERRRSKGM